MIHLNELAQLGQYQTKIEAALSAMENEQIVQRIWAGDHSVWKPDPTEISNRLGWLRAAESAKLHLSEIQSFADIVREDGIPCLAAWDGGRVWRPKPQKSSHSSN
jgi:hypothetical protein